LSQEIIHDEKTHKIE